MWKLAKGPRGVARLEAYFWRTVGRSKDIEGKERRWILSLTPLLSSFKPLTANSSAAQGFSFRETREEIPIADMLTMSVDFTGDPIGCERRFQRSGRVDRGWFFLKRPRPGRLKLTPPSESDRSGSGS